jgi:addiction module RelE/StbE family toxin
MAVLLFARLAKIDLLDAWEYIAKESLVSADHVFDVIQSEAEMLLTQPLMGRARPELGNGVRSWPTSTPYILFYLVTGDGITVLRVLHHARDLRNEMLSTARDS